MGWDVTGCDGMGKQQSAVDGDSLRLTQPNFLRQGRGRGSRRGSGRGSGRGSMEGWTRLKLK